MKTVCQVSARTFIILNTEDSERRCEVIQKYMGSEMRNVQKPPGRVEPQILALLLSPLPHFPS